MTRQNIIDKLKQAVSELPTSVKVWVFGSEARGEAREDSDIDLLVLNEGSSLTNQQKQAIFKTFFKIELETGVQINTHFQTISQWNTGNSLFKVNVNNDRVAL